MIGENVIAHQIGDVIIVWNWPKWIIREVSR